MKEKQAGDGERDGFQLPAKKPHSSGNVRPG